MMRSALIKVLGLVLLVLLLLGAALLLARQQRFEWTTDSRAALEAFQAGQDALGKLYSGDAVDRFEEALEKDPDFAAAQFYLVMSMSRGKGSPQRMKDLVDALQEQDLEPLTPRERTLLRVFRSRVSGERGRATEILRTYLDSHPDDPYVLDLYCHDLVTSGPAYQDEAERCLRHLIQIDPNRVGAQNLLAYIAMNRGDFAQAEEQFEIYRYLAPDQANPHDSLGELLMVTGRYDEARQEFRTALELKADFCPPWGNLVTLALLEGDGDRALETLREARRAAGCPAPQLDGMACAVDLWPLAMEGRWEELWGRSRGEGGPCDPEDSEAAHLGLRAAIETGRLEEARAIQQTMAERSGLGPGESYSERSPLALHMAALLADAEGDPEGAIQRLRTADEILAWGGGLGVFKLFNRLQLAAVLAGAGREDEAARVLEELARINRRFAEAPPVPPSHPVPPVPPVPNVPPTAGEPPPPAAAAGTPPARTPPAGDLPPTAAPGIPA